MKKIFFFAVLTGLASFPQNVFSQVPTPSPTPDLSQQIQKLQDELNQLELQTESLQSKSSQVQKPTVGFDGGTLEQDFESNSDSWSIQQGQILGLKFFADPTSNVTSHFDLLFWGRVAPDILHYSYLPTLASENIFFALREADVTMDTPLLSFRAFTGLAHDGFYNSYDDFYYLYPAATDVDTPWRVSGRPVPTGMEIKGKGDLDGLDIWAGQELIWGANQQVYVAYKHNIGATTFGVIDKVQLQTIDAFSQGTTYAPAVTVTGYTTAPQNIAEAFWKVPVWDAFVWDNVGLYNPYNVNKPYTYVASAAPGTGTDGTNYTVYQSNTIQTDALGYQTKLTTHAIPGLDTVMVNGEYSGLLANDLERISGEIVEVPAPYCMFTFDATAQKPIIGPNPLIYNGSGIGTLVQPRGEYDPFQITMNPISGVNNRQMTKFSLSFVFNNGNGWFFKYNPNVFDSYNVNMNLDTPFSTGIIGTLFNYPTGTDLTSYVNQAGILAWEPPGFMGQPATDGYLPYVHWVTMLSTGGIHWVADLQGGYSMAILGQTTVSAGNGQSSTDLFQGNLTARIDNTSLMFGYGQNVWAPEYWDQQFGLTIGRLFLWQVTQKFGLSQVSLKWESWSNLPGDPYQFSAINGVSLPIEELYATYTLNF